MILHILRKLPQHTTPTPTPIFIFQLSSYYYDTTAQVQEQLVHASTIFSQNKTKTHTCFYSNFWARTVFWGLRYWGMIKNLDSRMPPKTSAKIASLNSSIARGALRSRRCLQAPGLQAPAESQVSKRNTRITVCDAIFAEVFWSMFSPSRDEYGKGL